MISLDSLIKRSNKPYIILDHLVETGDLKSYTRRILDGRGQPIDVYGQGEYEYEELTLEFPSGAILIIESFCSGSSQNTCLIYQTE